MDILEPESEELNSQAPISPVEPQAEVEKLAVQLTNQLVQFQLDREHADEHDQHCGLEGIFEATVIQNIKRAFLGSLGIHDSGSSELGN